MEKHRTSSSGASSLTFIIEIFLYIETCACISGDDKVFDSFERTDPIQISIINFYWNRCSSLFTDAVKSRGCFGIQLLLIDTTWSTRYSIPRNDRCSISSPQWTLVSLTFNIENYGIKVLSTSTKTHYVFGMDHKNYFIIFLDQTQIIEGFFINVFNLK